MTGHLTVSKAPHSARSQLRPFFHGYGAYRGGVAALHNLDTQTKAALFNDK
jgi:hypothetical protein